MLKSYAALPIVLSVLSFTTCFAYPNSNYPNPNPTYPNYPDSNRPNLPPQNPNPNPPKEEVAVLDRSDSHDVYRRYENRGDLDYRQNWRYDPEAYFSGASPYQPYTQPYQDNYYYYYDQRYYRPDLYNRPYHRGDWNYKKNWRYNRDAYLSGEVDQSDYYRRAYYQGINQDEFRQMQQNRNQLNNNGRYQYNYNVNGNNSYYYPQTR